MNRRRFLRNSAGVLVPLSFGIITRASAQSNFGLQQQIASDGVTAAGGCSTVRTDTTGNATSDYDPAFYNSARTKIAYNFTAGATYTACAASISAYSSNSPNWGVKLAVFTDSSGAPGTIVGSASNEVATTSFPTTEGIVAFTGMSAALTNGTTYWLVIFASSGTPPYNFSPAIRWVYYGAGTFSLSEFDGSVWTTIGGANKTGKLKIYSS